MSAAESEAYWRDVVAKLGGGDPQARNWAAHVLATDFPPGEKSNLDRVLEYHDGPAVKEVVSRLAAEDEDWLTVSYCDKILEMFATRNV